MIKNLEDHAYFIRGVTYGGGEATSNQKQNYLPILRAGNIQRDLLTNSDLVWVPKERVSKDQIFRRGDVAICLSSSSPLIVGKSAILDREWEGSIGGFCGIIRAHENTDPLFLSYWLRSNDFLKWRDSQARGANIQNLRFTELGKVEVSFPNIQGQRRIAARLKKQMAAVDEMRQAAKNQEDAVMPLFEKTLAEAFHGITPLSLGIRADEAPAGWQWRRLLDLARLESGHTPSRRHPEYWENGDIPWLALPDIRALDCQVVHVTSEHTHNLGIANSSARILPENTVALSRTASVGFVTRFGRPMATSQDFVNWICGTELDPAFLMWLLRASRKFIRSVSTGAIHQTVYVDVVNQFEVCIPDLARQRKIAALMDDFFIQTAKLRQALREQNEAISALPGAYLAQAFSSGAD